MIELRNPLPRSVRDAEKIDKFFRQFGGEKKQRWVVPYYGISNGASQSFLALLKHLTSKSPSYKSAEKSIGSYAFGGFQDNTFFESLSDYGLSKARLLKVVKSACRHFFQCGNAWVRIEVTNFEGRIQVRLKNEHYLYVAYINTTPDEEREAIVVTDWEWETWNSEVYKRPEILPVSTLEDSFVWREKPGSPGTVYTLVHIREEGNDESDWYGRPDILAVLEFMFSEIAMADQMCRVNSTDLVARLLLFFEEEEGAVAQGDDDDEEDGFQQTIRALRSIVSNESQGREKKTSGLAAIEYGNGTKPPAAVKLDINRDTAWFQANMEEAKAMIYSVMCWYRELSGMNQAKTGIGANTMTNLFLVANAGTIEPLQNEWEGHVNTILEEIGELIGQSWSPELLFENKIETLVEALRATGSQSQFNANTAPE